MLNFKVCNVSIMSKVKHFSPLEQVKQVKMSESKFVKTHMRSKNTSCEVYNYFMLAVCFTNTKLTSKVHNYRTKAIK
jgi:hypothetical protein